jgi:SAM-dependent methyltransferase
MDPTYTLQYEKYEKEHWWHVARGELIVWAMEKFGPKHADASWLDIGCGTGVLLESYNTIPSKMGIEMDASSVDRARSKGLNVLQQIDTKDFAYNKHGTFDLITLCDVIEHIEDDRAAIAGVYDALKPNGIALVTVPAMKSLWSAHDIRNHHFRRYSKRDMTALFPSDKWSIRKVTYFSTALLPLIWPYRQFKRMIHGTDPTQTADDKRFGPPLIDRTFLALFRAECRLLKHMPMPLGSSLLLVAKKQT